MEARGIDAAGADDGTDVVGADGTIGDGASCCGTVTGAGCWGTVIGPGCCWTGAGAGLGAGITGEAATGGVGTGAAPGQGRPVLPPQTLLDNAIATIISSGICSAAWVPAIVRPSRTVHITAATIVFMSQISFTEVIEMVFFL